MTFVNKFLLYFLLFILIFPLSLYGDVSPQKFQLSFSGNLGFDLPISSTHLKFNGDFKILNLQFSGDFDFELLNKTPLKFRLSSKVVRVNIKKLLNVLKRLGYLSTLPKDLKGQLVAYELNLLVDGDTYNLKLKRACGAYFRNNKLVLDGVVAKINLKDNQINLLLKSLTLGKTKVKNLEFKYFKKDIWISSDRLNIDLAELSKTILSYYPDIKTKLIEKLKNIINVKDIGIGGVLKFNHLKLKIAHQEQKNIYILDEFSSLISTNSIYADLITNINSSPITAVVLTNSTMVKYINKNLSINSDTMSLILKDFYYPKGIKAIGWDIVFIPKVCLSSNFNLNYVLESNSSLKLNGKLISEDSFILTDREGSSIEFRIDPVEISLENRLLSVKSNKITANLTKIVYPLPKNKNIYYTGTDEFSDFYILMNLDKKKFNMRSSFSMSNSYVKYEDINTKINKLFTNIALDNDLLCLKTSTLDAELNKHGKVLLNFDAKIPLSTLNGRIKKIYKNLLFQLHGKDLILGKVKISSIEGKKEDEIKTKFIYNLNLNNVFINGNTCLNLQENRVDIITRSLSIKDFNLKKKEKKSDSENKKQKDIPIKVTIPAVVSDISKHYHFEFDNINYIKGDREYDISSLKGDLLLKEHPVIGFGCYFCNLYCSGGGEFLKQGISASLNIKGVGVPIDHLIGCFLRKVPVYITGDTNIQGSIMTQGATIGQLKKNLSFDGFVIVDNGKILKLSNLGKKVELILDVLHFVRLNPSKLEDSLEFNKIITSISGGLKLIKLKEIKITSPVLNFYSTGTIDLDKHVIEISGEIKKGFLSKQFHLTKKLKEKRE